MGPRHYRREFTGIGIEKPKYPLDVVGDINCTGTVRINGVPITAFYQRPEPHIRPLTFVSGKGISVDMSGNVVTISSTIPELKKQEPRFVEGDNIIFSQAGDKVTINSDPGNWIDYIPVVSIKSSKAKAKSAGQYIAYGPICFVQASVEVTTKDVFKVSLPIAGFGSVMQSLNIGFISGPDLIVEPDKRGIYLINGSYRIA